LVHEIFCFAPQVKTKPKDLIKKCENVVQIPYFILIIKLAILKLNSNLWFVEFILKIFWFAKVFCQIVWSASLKSSGNTGVDKGDLI
jgi:hypothetical protein